MIYIKRMAAIVRSRATRKGHTLQVVAKIGGKERILSIDQRVDFMFGFRNEIGTATCSKCGMTGQVSDIPGHEMPEGDLFAKKCPYAKVSSKQMTLGE